MDDAAGLQAGVKCARKRAETRCGSAGGSVTGVLALFAPSRGPCSGRRRPAGTRIRAIPSVSG